MENVKEKTMDSLLEKFGPKRAVELLAEDPRVAAFILIFEEGKKAESHGAITIVEGEVDASFHEKDGWADATTWGEDDRGVWLQMPDGTLRAGLKCEAGEDITHLTPALKAMLEDNPEEVPN